MRQLTDEQRIAVNKDEEDFNVLAAAGSGKTLVLSERYLRLVKDRGYRPSEILTITFTNKAAAEMKRRIVNRLRDERLFEAAQEAETGPIQTIHSFCERLLRENAVEAGIDPEFEIMGISDAISISRYALERSCVVSEEMAPDARFAMGILMGNQAFQSTSSSDTLMGLVSTIESKLRSGGVPREEIAERYSSSTAFLQWSRHLLEDSLPREVVIEMKAGPPLEWSDSIAAAYARLKLKGKPVWVNKNTDATEQFLARILCGVVQMACETWRILEAEMRVRQAFDFTALEARAVRLLEQRPAIRERMARLYPIVMVDEAQDVNPMQYRLLTALSPKSLMMVGDDQQSIFGFRDADVELFRTRSQKNSVLLTKNHRSTASILRFVDDVFGALWSSNYRMMLPPEPLDLALATSEAIESAQKSDRYEGVEMWHLAHKTDWLGLSELVRQLNAEGVSSRDIAILVRGNRAAAGVAETFRRVGIGVQLVSGPEKFYTRLEVHDLANTLTALVSPTNNYALLATLRSPVVGLSLDSIVLLSQQEVVAQYLPEFIPALESDQPKLKKFLSWFPELAKISERLPAYEVLSGVLADSDLMNNLARREDYEPRVANVRKLLTIACSRPEVPTSEFADIIREIQELKHKEGEAPFENDWDDLVTVSTTHKAKGLEWPVVILADAMEYVSGNVKSPTIDAPRGLVGLGHKKNHLALHEYLKVRKKAREDAEQYRLMYVAVTRARQRLCICQYGNKLTGLVKVIQQGLGQEAMASMKIRQPQ